MVDYHSAWRAMQAFTGAREAFTRDEIWLAEHPAVYTLGSATRAQHLPRADLGIPLIKSDRGGQITFHGPGQILLYVLLDLQRRALSVRDLVELLESAVIDLLAEFGIRAHGNRAAPGVYVDGAKIAALGLRIKRGCCYHGLALNIDVALEPFALIDPCGYPGLAVTRTRDLGITAPQQALEDKLLDYLLARLDE
jgi:lipoyl(octanoyl) transferase